MLILETTPHLYGTLLQGDYCDLNELYDSLSRYLTFYQTVEDTFPYYEYEYMLSLNYDIRHAYMGSREVLTKENNADQVGILAENIFQISSEASRQFQNIRDNCAHGNLYFGVNILYPLIFHYLFTLEAILDDEPLPRHYRKAAETEPIIFSDYDELSAEKDRAVIRHFTALVWENISGLFGKETVSQIYSYFREKEYYHYPPAIYTDALTHCQLAIFPALGEEDRKSFLLAALLEIMGTEEIIEHPRRKDISGCRQLYWNALSSLKKAGKTIFPAKESFYLALEQTHTPGKPLYENDFDDFLDRTYGIAPEEDPEW